MSPIKLKELEKRFHEIPDKPGIYWYEIDQPIKKALFKEDNPAGHYRGKDPTVRVVCLQEKWVSEATIVYIGETKNLRKRIRLRARFANGEPVRAWGGRYLWQLDDAIQKRMAVRCKVDQDYKTAESLEISEFKNKYGKLPFANLVTPKND
ncbi:MAG: hypothetical protein AAB947_00530 [Patescibacteria group bacterium]|mgnify:CR=1 FL=1